MKENNENISEVISLVSKDMDKIGVAALPAKSKLHNMDELKKYLAQKIAELMDRNYEKLINALYLIDLDEKKLHELFSVTNRDYIPEVLAGMIIERQIQKLQFRKKYKEGKI